MELLHGYLYPLLPRKDDEFVNEHAKRAAHRGAGLLCAYLVIEGCRACIYTEVRSC